jgi:predicted enzyme involved in methoxymalonyl-ACP biosynthesis
VVWDLDNTLWKGILLEDGNVQPNAHVVKLLHHLDQRVVNDNYSSVERSL